VEKHRFFVGFKKWDGRFEKEIARGIIALHVVRVKIFRIFHIAPRTVPFSHRRVISNFTNIAIFKDGTNNCSLIIFSNWNNMSSEGVQVTLIEEYCSTLKSSVMELAIRDTLFAVISLTQLSSVTSKFHVYSHNQQKFLHNICSTL